MVDNGVNPPGGASFNAPMLDFSAFGNLYNDYRNKQTIDQQQQLNQAKIQQINQQIELSKAFAGGLPTDPSTGQIDYRKAAAILASKGDVAGAVSLLQQQPPPISPLLGGQPQQGAPQAAPQPASVQARPLPPPAQNSPQGDSGQNTVTSLVTDRLPSQNQTTGETILKIAQTMGVDPNAQLTPGQQKRAQGLLQKYASDTAGVQVASNGGGGLPPSANAGTPAARVSQQPPQVQPQASPSPQGGQPIIPQVPLPPGFNDPQKAILAIREEAARYANMPNGKSQASLLENYAQRIEDSIKPVKLGQYDTYVSPSNPSQVVAQGPGAAALRGEVGTDTSTLDADAELYRQTGKLPPNMGRGIQGAAQATRIRERAVQQEVAEGGDPADWPQKWQSFGAQAAGLRILQTRSQTLKLAENESTTLIPRVREASARVSRTEYPTINALIEAAQTKTGGKDVIKLGIAVESLVPVYARILKPTGDLTEGAMKRSHDILDKAWSDGQINAALDQMEVEKNAARAALEKTLEEAKVSAKKKPDDKSSPNSASTDTKPQGTTASGVKWSVE